MRHLAIWSLLGTSLLLTACMHTPRSSHTSEAAQQMQCQPEPAKWAVGKTNTEHTVEEARKRAGAYQVRVLRPNQPTTREFNAGRLNLLTDSTGRITQAFCG